MNAPTVLRGHVDRAQDLAERMTALDPTQVDAGVVGHSPSPADWCQRATGCERPAELTVSAPDPFSGRPWEPTEYCGEHGLAVVSWLLQDPGRDVDPPAPLICVEVWRAT